MDPVQTVTATSSAQATQPNADAEAKAPVVAADPKAAAPAPAPDAQTAAEKVAATAAKPEGDKPEAQPEKPQAEPEYNLTLAEGSLLDPEADIKAVVEFAKANKMAPEVAGKILEQREQAVKAYHEHQKAAVNAAVDAWKAELPGDPEIGGEKLPGALEDSKRLLEQFADKELVEAVNTMGFGNNKYFVRFLARLGKARRDDSLVTSGTAPKAEKSLAERMFPMNELQGQQG